MQTVSSHLNTTAFLEGFLAGITPEVKLGVSEWSDKYRMLSNVASSEPGPWRTDRAPYTREIMECLNPDSPVEEIVFMKGAQIGGTELGNNWIGFIVDHSPGPVMMVLPSTETAKRVSKQRIAPMLEETPQLRQRVRHNRSRDSGNTQLIKEFSGGVLVITGANSAVGLRSLPIRNLFMDEIDAYPVDVDGEGDPIQLAIKRTNTYKRTRKIFKVSTPLIKDRSRIEKDYLRGDQRRYYVPCPECQAMQPIDWKNIVWEKDADGKHLPATAAFACRECGAISGEHHKTWMLEHGRWVAEGEADGRVASFHLSALYSPLGWYSWSDAVTEFLESKDDQAALQVFTNTVLGETFAHGGERPDENSLLARREVYAEEVPAGALVLVAGVDVQDDRLEVEVHGYGHGEECWPIDKRIIYGDPSQADVWRGLDDVLGGTYKHELGAIMPVQATCIDSGGHHTQMVYDYVKARQTTRRIWAVKGMGGEARPVVSAPSKKKSGYSQRKVDLFTVGVDVIKSLIYRRLLISTPGPGCRHFPLSFASGDVCDEEYFAQLTAERVVTHYKRGWPTQVWEKIRPRNEVLDLSVYAYAAMKLLNPVWDTIQRRLVAEDHDDGQAVPEKGSSKSIRQIRNTGRRGFVSKYKRQV